MVSNASEDFPEPDRPVKTINASRGKSRSTLRRLCSRAPFTIRRSATQPLSPGHLERQYQRRNPAGHTTVSMLGVPSDRQVTAFQSAYVARLEHLAR